MNLFNKFPSRYSLYKYLLLFIAFTIFAGNVTNSFLLKWGFREDFEPPLVVAMLDGVAKKPFVFRSALPLMANSMVNAIPKETQENLFKKISRYDSLKKHYFSNIPNEYWNANNALVYHFMYLMIFWSFFASLIFIYLIANHLTSKGFKFSLLTTCMFSLIYPLTFQNGGYFYDFIELLGLFAGTYYFLSGRILLSTLILFIASFNKETTFLFAIFLSFLHARDKTTGYKIKWTSIQTASCLVGYFYLQWRYASSPGGIVEKHLAENLIYWSNPISYIQFSNLIGKGVATPDINSIFFMLPFLSWLKSGWSISPSNRRYFLMSSLLVSFALLLFFGFKNEIRNLSLAFPAFFIILVVGGSDFFDRIHNYDKKHI